MGRSRSTQPELNGAPATDPPTIDPVAEAEELSYALDQFPSEAATVRIYKWGQRGAGVGDEGWIRCGRMLATELDADSVPLKWGPGRYRFQFLGADSKILSTRSETFAAPVGPPQAPTQHPAPTSSNAGAADPLIQFMITQLGAYQQMILAFITKNSGAGGVSIADVLTAFREGRAMAPASGTESIMEAVRLGVEVASSGGAPDGGGGSVLENVAGRVLGLLDRALPAGQQAPAVATHAAQMSPQLPAAGAATAAAAPAPAAQPVEPLMQLARQWAPTLLREAERGRDGYVWGQFIAERVSVEWMPVLKRLVDATPEDRMRVLTGVDPRIGGHSEWIEDATEGIRDVLYGQGAEPSERGGGDLDQRGGDAAPDPGPGAPASSAGDGRPVM